jgi:hypothetical protein
MIDLTTLLQEATSNIGEEYFLLPVVDVPAVFRERVYCYELYHQLRSLWPTDSPYRLNGEVDKRSHPYFEGKLAPKPDLLVHVPGSDENYAAIEVKSSSGSLSGIRKDFQTLAILRKLGYQKSLFLIYGESITSVREKLDRLNGLEAQILETEIWVHENFWTSAEKLD